MTRIIPIGKIAETIGADIERFCIAVKISTFSGVVRDSRVDTGRMRGNWQLTQGSPASSEIERLDKDGNDTINEIVQNSTGSKVDYLTNNLDYAEVWNDKDLIIDKNVARIERNLRDAASKIEQ